MNLFLRILNWIWFWETWSWYLGSIWNLNHAILLGHGCIMDEFFEIWFLETLTQYLKTWTCISWYWILKEMSSRKIEGHNITTTKWEVGKWKDTNKNDKEMRGRKMKGRHKHYKQGNEKQEDGRTQALSILCHESSSFATKAQ